MKQHRTTLTALATAIAMGAFAAAPAAALDRGTYQERSDQSDARQEMRAGNHLPLREIQRRVLAQMGDAEYLGNAYDKNAKVYVFKFVRNGRVVQLNVDPRTGRILKRSR